MAFQQWNVVKGHNRRVYISTVKGGKLTTEATLSVSFPRQPAEGSMLPVCPAAAVKVSSASK
jgi:hypothetical protein